MRATTLTRGHTGAVKKYPEADELKKFYLLLSLLKADEYVII